MRDLVAPSDDDVKIAKESSRILAPMAASDSTVQVQVRSTAGKPPQTIELPKGALRLLLELLTEMSKGNAVTLMPIHAQLTTQQAADILGVSRPFIIKQIREKKIPFHAVGTHRRILFKDLMAYRRQCRQEHDEAMDELVDQAQELNLGY